MARDVMIGLKWSGWRRTCLALASITILTVVAGQNVSAQSFVGVNLAGAAFSPNKLPGRFGWEFVYPTQQEVDYFTHKGMNVFRVSVLWERLQPRLDGPLDEDEIGRLDGFIKLATAVHSKVVIDIHNYGSYRSQLIGQGEVTSDRFSDLWTRLAKRFATNPDVIFGLMNEPQIPDPSAWMLTVQGAITAIRGTGAANLILVPGIAWDAAHNFAVVSGPTLVKLRDPAHHYAFEVHEYFDRDSSGTSEQCVPAEAAVARLKALTAWLRSTSHQAFLGEFGAARNAACLDALRSALEFMHENRDVWIGWTYWAAGPLWGDYMFSLEPSRGADRPQMTILEPFLRAAAEDGVHRP